MLLIKLMMTDDTDDLINPSIIFNQRHQRHLRFRPSIIFGLKYKPVYLVFVPNTVKLSGVREQNETIENIVIKTFIVLYDEENDF